MVCYGPSDKREITDYTYNLGLDKILKPSHVKVFLTGLKFCEPRSKMAKSSKFALVTISIYEMVYRDRARKN